MKRYGRLSVIFFLMLVTSVLFLSCGIPTYCTLESVSVSAKSSQENNVINFSISGADPSLSDVKEGPGLLLIYTNSSSSLAKDFKAEYISDSVNGKPVIMADQNTGRFATLGTDERILYAFKNVNDTTESWPSAWSYSFDLSGYHDQIAAGTLMLSLTYDKGIYQLKNNDSIIAEYKRGDVTFEDKDIYVFAVVTTQGTNSNLYSNIYWTEMSYIGKISEIEPEIEEEQNDIDSNIIE